MYSGLWIDWQMPGSKIDKRFSEEIKKELHLTGTDIGENIERNDRSQRNFTGKW